MKILNLYCGIGGNRKLWGDEHEITAIEHRQDIADVYKHYFPNDKVIVTDAHQYLLDHYKEYKDGFVWTSTPCQTHSRARFWAHGDDLPVYPDMKLYQEILFLQHYYEGKWVAENVKPYYKPLINPSVELGRHFFWANFRIPKTMPPELNIHKGNEEEWSNELGFDLRNFKMDTRKDQIYRNCVHPETGLMILNVALNVVNSESFKPGSLFS